MTSTTKRGDSFRDIVVSMLEAAGFRASSEVLVEFKKTDAVWQRDDIDGTVTYLVEAKDYAGALPRKECSEFVSEYGQLVRIGKADRAWLISKGDIVSSGRAHVEAERGCKAMTFAEFQRRLLGIDSYLRDLLAKFENDRIEAWYVPPHTEDGATSAGGSDASAPCHSPSFRLTVAGNRRSPATSPRRSLGRPSRTKANGCRCSSL